ncbi:MAG: PilN domain-containing protein [Desulfosalsimonas sp.]|uniref:PilN domain-containing protein n=1 Tax=Desulfosalsimonas sp. TaxID=3073848 RepID=UPI0039706D43
MIRINLLPFRAARTKENIRRQVSVFLLSMVLLLLVLFAVNTYMGNRVGALETRLDSLNEDIDHYSKQARQVDVLKKELADLEQKILIIEQLKSHRTKPPLLLADLTERVVPERMQLQKMNYNGSELMLNGIAMDNETIAVFMSRLERSGKIVDVSLENAKQTTQYDVEMKSFGIKCKMADASAVANEKAKK